VYGTQEMTDGRTNEVQSRLLLPWWRAA